MLADSDWLDLLRGSASGQRVQLDGRPLPVFPDRDLQLRTVGQAGPDTIEEAWSFAAQCLSRFGASSRFQEDRKVLLDFGTGWGRIARCFLRDVRAEDIFGIDFDRELIAVCRNTFPGPRFLRCNPMPPLVLRENSVDFVVGYSVFSHLSEAACLAWSAEFARVLKPGGMAALGTRGRWFFDYARSVSGQDSYSQSLRTMFPDFEAAKTRYDRGELVHSNAPGLSGGGALDADFYGETFIPEGFASKELGKTLKFTDYAEEKHPILFFKKSVFDL